MQCPKICYQQAIRRLRTFYIQLITSKKMDEWWKIFLVCSFIDTDIFIFFHRVCLVLLWECLGIEQLSALVSLLSWRKQKVHTFFKMLCFFPRLGGGKMIKQRARERERETTSFVIVYRINCDGDGWLLQINKEAACQTYFHLMPLGQVLTLQLLGDMTVRYDRPNSI